MDKINSKSNNYSTKFKGVNKMEDKAVQSLESYTKGVINKLSQRVEKKSLTIQITCRHLLRKDLGKNCLI